MDPKTPDSKNVPTILDGKYILKEKVGNGSFGQIYIAFCQDNSQTVAIKVEKRSSTTVPILGKEAKVLSELNGEKGFPRVYHFGREPSFNYMAIELLGQDLQKLLKTCHYRFSLKTSLMLMDQMLTRIEVLHSKGYLHRDIKPENFCMNNDPHGELYLIDFGLSRSFKDITGKHIECIEKKGLVGTARYASVNSHMGLEQSRRDDLEAIGYTIIYLMKGKLPWQDLKAADRQEKYEMIGNLKLTTPIPVLCKDLPQEFATYLSYVKGLDFIEKPDYKYLKGLFRTLFLKSGFEFDFAYDWLSSKQKEELKYINKNARDYSKGGVQKTISTNSNNDINEGPVLHNKPQTKGVVEAKRYRGSIVSLAKDIKEPEISTYRFLINGETPSGQLTKGKWESTKIIEQESPFNRTKNTDNRRTSMEMNEDKLGKNLLFSDYSNKMSSITSAITSDHSSKVPNVSRSKYEEEEEIPIELTINASPSIVIQQTKPIQTKTKDSYYSSQIFDTLQPQNDTSRTDLRKRTFSRPNIDFDDDKSPIIKGTMRTRFASGQEKAMYNIQEENLNDSSICEKVVAQKKTINLISQRRFSARGDKIF